MILVPFEPVFMKYSQLVYSVLYVQAYNVILLGYLPCLHKMCAY